MEIKKNDELINEYVGKDYFINYDELAQKMKYL
jgi:hypothetical protein